MQVLSYLPGIGLAALIGLIALIITNLIAVDFISVTVLAIFIGVLVSYFIDLPQQVQPGIKFSAKRLLKGFIILLGASMDLTLVVLIGGRSLILLAFTITAAFLSSYLIGKSMGTDNKMTQLLAVGGAICGGSAITAVSPIIKAEEEKIAYAVSTVFLIDLFLIILFPLVAQQLGMSNLAAGMWSGTAINDTASVVAASFSISPTAGEIATMVKMTRTLAIIPVVFAFSLKQNRGMSSKSLKSVFPWFILGFVALALINTLGWIPESLSGAISWLRQFFMVTALAAIGLKTDLSAIKVMGFKPFIHSALVSLVIIVVSLGVISFIV